jgi:parvulin-like peptidyl-prolyl isomerase
MRLNKTIPLLILAIFATTASPAEVVEEIYAVVNGETVTYSEFKNAEYEMLKNLRSQLTGKELEQEVKMMRKELLERLINHKLIISKAKEKKYQVDNEVELIIAEIKKQNNLKSDMELRRALEGEGITLEEFKKQQKLMRMQQRYMFEEITSKIEIDNAEIMDYYRANIETFTKPMEFSLNCIFLNKEFYFDKQALEGKKNQITKALESREFAEVAKEFSELEGPEDKMFLGNFKEGELDKNLEDTARELKENEISSWIETDNGWYIISLIKKTMSSLIDYKEVREQIKNRILSTRQQAALNDFLEELRKESYIKVFVTL